MDEIEQHEQFGRAQEDRLKLALGVFESCETSKDVGARLKRYGVRGVRRSATKCPVANYLRTYFFPHHNWVSVSPDEVYVDDVRWHIQCATPEVVGQFMHDFDLGMIYPSLSLDKISGDYSAY